MNGTKKLWIALGAIIVIVLVILVSQIKTAFSITTKAEQLPLVSPMMVAIRTTSTDPMLGNPGAPLTLVGFFDITDTKSRKLYQEVSNFVSAHPSKARLIWKDAPGTGFFVDPIDVHKAAICARMQGKFWPYLNALTTSDHRLNSKTLSSIASELSLSLPAWETCQTEITTDNILLENMTIARELQLPPAPILFINNKLLNPDADIDLTQFLSTLIEP